MAIAPMLVKSIFLSIKASPLSNKRSSSYDPKTLEAILPLLTTARKKPLKTPRFKKEALSDIKRPRLTKSMAPPIPFNTDVVTKAILTYWILKYHSSGS